VLLARRKALQYIGEHVYTIAALTIFSCENRKVKCVVNLVVVSDVDLTKDKNYRIQVCFIFVSNLIGVRAIGSSNASIFV
jgi:hypothetical protein